MRLTNFLPLGSMLILLGAALPAVADTQFQIRRMTRNDVPPGKGQCDIRLQVDNEIEVTVRRDMVFVRTLSGQDPRDDGSECNAPLPERDLQGFNFEVQDSRNEIRLLAEPSRRNNFAAIVHIRDSSGGFGRYHFRLSWQMTGGGEIDRPRPRDNDAPPPGRRGGFAWNREVHFSGPGRGESRTEGFGIEPLRAVTVDVDRGRVQVSFRTESGPPLAFSGEITARDGDVLRAEVVSERRRLRGSMFLSLDNRDSVYRITLEAGEGRDRMRLNWERR